MLPFSFTVTKRGQRGRTVFWRDPSGSISTRHFPGIVDVLAHGSQTVVPPTPHPETGLLYYWTTDATLLDASIARLPSLPATLPTNSRQHPLPGSKRRSVQHHNTSHCNDVSFRRANQNDSFAMSSDSLRELAALAAMTCNSGRNQVAFQLVCRVGRWVHRSVISQDRLVYGVLRACECNRLVRDDGRRAVLATIASGLTKSADDALPDLETHHG